MTQPIFKQGDRVKLRDGTGTGTVDHYMNSRVLTIYMDEGGDVLVLPYEIEHLTVVERLADLAP